MERAGLAESGGAGAERRTVAPADADDAGAAGLARRPGRQENPGVGVGWRAARAPPCGCRRRGYDLRQLARATCRDRACAAREGLTTVERTWSISAGSPARPSISSFIRIPLEFGHTLEDQIGAQIGAGFSIVGFYEDGWSADPAPLHRLMKCYIATRAQNMKASPIGSADFRFVSFIAERR